MTQPSGWYDDPQDPSQLRYWDGVAWSTHTSPKVSPTAAQSTIGMPYGVSPASARPQAPGSQGAQGGRPAAGDYLPPRHDLDQGQQGQGQGQQGSGQFAPPLQGWQSQPSATTPDGVALAGWWKRVLARILDSFIVGIVSTPLVFAPMRRVVTIFLEYSRQVQAAVKAGSSTAPALPSDQLTGPILLLSLGVLAVSLAYEIFFLTRTGATLGKRVVGISVRLRDQPGPPPLVAVLKRTAVKEGGRIIGLVPVIGSVGSLFSLIDVLWPLWDVKKQAVHDKLAATNVVVGPQPRPRRDV